MNENSETDKINREIEQRQAQKLVADRITEKLMGYAKGRIDDVQRGLETPRSAGLLVQKYGYGLCDAFHEIYGNNPGYYCPTY